MTTTPLANLPGRPCPIAAALELVGERWALLVVREIALGATRFSDIVAGTGAPRDRIAARLKALERAGVVVRSPYHDGPRRYEYRLTESGDALIPVLDALLAWGKHHAVSPDDPDRQRTYRPMSELEKRNRDQDDRRAGRNEHPRGLGAAAVADRHVARTRAEHRQGPRDGRSRLLTRDGRRRAAPAADRGVDGFEIVSADPGRVVFTCQPDESAYNPIGAVHGGSGLHAARLGAGSAMHSTCRGQGLHLGRVMTVLAVAMKEEQTGTGTGTAATEAVGRITVGATAATTTPPKQFRYRCQADHGSRRTQGLPLTPARGIHRPVATGLSTATATSTLLVFDL